MAEVFELVGEANRGEVAGAREAVRQMLDLLGLDSVAEAQHFVVNLDEVVRTSDYAQAEVSPVPSEAVDLLKEREKAREAKDFARADQIRDQLAELGWEVRDSADGPSLVPKA